MFKKNKNDLIKEISDGYDIDEAVVRTVINSFVNRIRIYMINGVLVSIKGFCTFTTKEVKARAYRSFDSDDLREVRSRRLPKAKFSNIIAEKIKEKGDA